MALSRRGLTAQTGKARIVRRSVDARGSKPVYVFRVEVWPIDQPDPEPVADQDYQDVHRAPPVHIVGAGPAGYMAALTLLRIGLRPVIFERGKDVRARRRDLRAIQQFGQVNPHSNYCFGEGGAGTYSDGKLYTRATKRGNVRAVLQALVAHGATDDILIDAHPHIGSNKLPKIIARIRATILGHGGEIHFGAHMTDFDMHDGKISAVVINGSDRHAVDHLILATGHSARDVYQLVGSKGLLLHFKPFAVGVRIEHPQPLIDKIQYGRQRGEHLPAASYRLACQVDGRGVFSFCMCPGGLVVPAATAPGEIVLNGMSLSRRDSPFANAGTVVAIEAPHVAGRDDTDGQVPALAGVQFQQRIEQACFALGDGSQRAPAQRLMDFLDGVLSSDLPDCSYIPGIFPADVASVFPGELSRTLREGIQVFGQRMKGYLTNEAVVMATESRTSAPVRIPRNLDTLEHPQLRGLYPCGEGAGFAGGIVSAALDGMRVAQSVGQAMGKALSGT